MKRRLLAGALLCAMMLAANAGVATKAQADPTGNESCRGHVALNWWRYDPNQWNYIIHTTWYCNPNETFSWEYQLTTDGGAHWTDLGAGDHGHRSDACTGGCFGDLQEPGVGCPSTGSQRVHYWWKGGDWHSASHGSGLVCAGNTFTN